MKAYFLILFTATIVISGCKKGPAKQDVVIIKSPEVPAKETPPTSKVNASPTWNVDARCFLDGSTDKFDDLAVKDPSIVFYNNNYHLFYTGRDKGDNGNWQTGYASAPTLEGLKTADRHYLSSLNAGSYFCAPQVFWSDDKNLWFLIFQSGKGASFSATTTISDPTSWAAVKSMGFSDGIDFWCIADDKDVYVFYSAQDGSHNIKYRQTSRLSFPYNWSEPKIAADDTFEAPHVYKNKADGNTT